MTTFDVLYAIGTGLMILAAVPANYIPLKYHLSLPWKTTTLGKVLMSKSVAVALVIDLAIARVLLGEHAVFAGIRTAVFAYFVVALYWQAVVMRSVIEDARENVAQGQRWPR